MVAPPVWVHAGHGAELQRYLREVSNLVRSQQNDRAIAVAAQAVERGHEHADLLTLAVYDRIQRRDLEKALAFATRARELEPRHPDALHALGVVLAKLGRQREALKFFDAALRQAPSLAQLHFNKGRALEDLNEFGRARIEFERAVELQSSHTEALARLAHLAATRGDAVAARGYGERSLRLNPKETVAKLALIFADLEERKFERALERARPVAGDASQAAVNRSIALGLMGDALDGLGRVPEAFDAYTSSQSTMRNACRSQYEAPGAVSAAARAEQLIERFRGTAPEDRRGDTAGDTASPARMHVFLVGFPRSGTTLLEQILDSHPAIASMPEKDCLVEAIQAFMDTPSDLQRLACARDDVLDPYRRTYWRHVEQFGSQPGGKVFIDKMPLNSILLCLVARLFPAAKILFAVRDPRDVVLSCFRRRFGMTPQMYELLTLEGAARYYDRVMTLAQLYREKLPLQVHQVRYESMVSDWESETQRVCAFLEIPFDNSMRKFAAHARANDVATPSAAQVARGIYTYGVGQWRRYGEQLQPIMPMLAPWVRHFGYEES